MNTSPGTLITVYVCGCFGATTTRGKLVAVRDLTHRTAKGIRYVPKGKRKEEQVSSRTLVVLEGHDHPDAPTGMIKMPDTTAGGTFLVSAEKSRYPSFDTRYQTDFNKWMNAYIAKSGVTPIVDQREEQGETDPTIGKE